MTKHLVSVFAICLLAVVLAGCAAPAAPVAPAAPAAPKVPEVPAAPAPKAPAKVIHYTLGSTSITSSAYPSGIKIAELVNKAVPEQVTTVVASGATHDNLAKMRKGIFDYATSTVMEGTTMAYQGKTRDEYIKAGPWPELRILWAASRLPLAITVLADAGVERVKDLEGKVFAAGIPGSAAEHNFKTALAALGVKPKYFVGSLEGAVEACKEGRCVGFGKAVSGEYLDATQLDLLSARKIKILHWTDEELKAGMAAVPGLGIRRYPANHLKPLAPHPPISTLEYYRMEVTTSKIPQDLGYRMWKAVVDGWDEHIEVYAPAAPIHPLRDSLVIADELARVIKVPPLHAGFVQLLVEKGFKVPKELIPPEYKPVK